MIRTVRCLALAAWVCAWPAAAWGQAFPINSDVALQPAEGQWIYRTQGRFRAAEVDATDPDTDVRVVVNSHVLVYGITSRASAVVGVPLVYRETDGPGPDAEDFGAGDVRLLGRYQVWKKLGHLSSQSWTLVGGIEIPSYDAPFSSRSWDPVVGTVYTWRKNKYGFDADVIYQVNTENDRDRELGDVLRYDLAVQRRIWPNEYTADTKWTLTALLECNGAVQWRPEIDGRPVAQTESHQVFVSPGLVAAGKRARLEVGVQVPVYQDVGRAAPEDRIRTVVGWTWTF